MIFDVLHNERGRPEFVINLERNAKGMTDTPDERSAEAICQSFISPSNHAVDRSTIYMRGSKPRPLLCNPILVKLTICLANNVFRDYKTIDEVLTLEPPDGEMCQPVELMAVRGSSAKSGPRWWRLIIAAAEMEMFGVLLGNPVQSCLRR